MTNSSIGNVYTNPFIEQRSDSWYHLYFNDGYMRLRMNFKSGARWNMILREERKSDNIINSTKFNNN
ncbi:unnamed protein product [marine sediment metagenome]|uniref:Uncharacterized protein n=1 Tax=marine sediment metagenome TaxID=412755 RepID=X0UDJ1_9ZZZZ